MNIIKFSAVILFTAFISTSIADVEDIIRAQKDIQNSEHDSQEEKEVTAISLGEKEFQSTCAICHGDNGKGKGAFSSQLSHKPSDLTQLNKQNAGKFPAIEVYEIIDGRNQSGIHGTRTMPIWGNRYEAESWLDVSSKFSGTIARGKILELILYLNTIQE
jgi:hypothetical protein